MSCCGCASRVLKLQSEIRSWKTKLADEKRENKMILRWILAVFGYEVRVDIDKETHGIRLQATENKEAVSKALIKLGLGGVNDGDVGMMVMELKLEDHEYYEPFEEPHDVPEFPILEINSMPTHPQVPLVNTGISSLGHMSQHHTAPTMTITTPMEVTSTPLPVSSQLSTEQEVMYISGNFEEGATIEGPNGQSYIIVRASEPEDMPMQLDYGVNEDVIGDGSNLFYRPSLPIGASEPQNVINYLSGSGISKNSPPVQLSLPTVVTPAPVNIPGPSVSLVPDSVIEQLSSSVFKTSSSSSSSSFKSQSKKKSLSSTKQVSNANSASKSSLKKQRSSGSGETNIKIKNVVSKALPPPPHPKQNPTKNTMNNSKPVNNMQQSQYHSAIDSLLDNVKTIKPTRQAETFPFTTAQTQPSSSPVGATKTETFQFGLTLREKAEMYVLQKAQESVERVSNGFRCTVCLENRYTYSNFETAMAHAKTHYESKPYKCENCDELFAIQKELLTHRKTVHPKSKGAAVTTTSPSPYHPPSTSRLIPQAHHTTQQQHQQSTKIMHAQSFPFNFNKSTNSGSYITVSNSNTTPNVTGGGQQLFTYPPQGKTIVVQAPMDNNGLRSGNISISSEVLAALFGGAVSQSSIVATSQPVSMSRMPTIVLAAQGQGANPNNKLPRNLSFSLNNVGGGVAYQTVDSKAVNTSFVK